MLCEERMKRGFLFGLGSFFIIGIIGGLLSLRQNVTIGVVATIICVPLSIVVVRAAKSASSDRSRLHAIVGWLIGFLAIDVIACAVGFVVWWIS
jgi:riboflavin transporter FmnP